MPSAPRPGRHRLLPLAARIRGAPTSLPEVRGPVPVIAAIHLAAAIIVEATRFAGPAAMDTE